MLHVEMLEERSTPAFVAGAGGLVFAHGSMFRPFDGYHGPLFVGGAGDLNGDSIDEIIVGAGDGGGPRVQVRDGNTFSVLKDLFVFEDTFRGGVRVAADNDYIYVGAGPGGGPVVVTYDKSFVERDRVFVGDKNVRTGADVDDIAYGVAHPKLFHAIPHPTVPGDTTVANSYIAAVPTYVQQKLIDGDQSLFVYTGNNITDMPEWAYLKGVLTPAEGDGNRTWDAVQGLYSSNSIYGPAAFIRQFESEFVTLHEIGHAFEWSVPEQKRNEWNALHPTIIWATPYESANAEEAFAESFRRWIQNVPQPNPVVDSFFDSI